MLFIYDLLDQAKNNRESYRVDAVEQAIRYMEENFHNSELKLEDVAGFVGRSPAYLSSLLTKKQGISFRQLLTSIRVKQAQRLLRETTLSVQEIADKAGFHSANYFNKIFKEKTGTTPRRYRNLKK
ncbi:helix-turn-helix transcriptional regulator [Brevibacillus massiliensis]|uniref:helix-turn-helix transcriptional regulator n=1 Tax=Brevibacillus massiliensis TaxID=1118054 RepID=UPI0002E3FF85|nr:helix-turn-helix transcriptional regulator [Brevibacillus massiliensis]